MAEINLTQTEADAPINMPKVGATTDEWEYPNTDLLRYGTSPVKAAWNAPQSTKSTSSSPSKSNVSHPSGGGSLGPAMHAWND